MFFVKCLCYICRFSEPFVLHVFRDVSLTQLVTALLCEMSKLMKEEAVERVRVEFTRSIFC